uniref:Polyprenal reductase n=1 Tax=Riptortus pedestris TaxID=329032 RepID=R4WT56_RIPPE|nr:dfg10 protein [Riptortus pedestris]
MNLLQLSFYIISFLVVFLGVIVNWFHKYAPEWVLKTYRYGKFSYNACGTLTTIQVPKRWFCHFYAVSSILTFSTFLLMFALNFKLIYDLPQSIKVFLHFIGTPSDTVPASMSFLAMFLLMVQCFKRFYETHFVSVFSDSKMDINHYLLGHFHYFGATLAIFSESSRTFSEWRNVTIWNYSFLVLNNLKFSTILISLFNQIRRHMFSSTDIGLKHFLAAAVFLWACKSQLDCAKILANLRKNDKGKVVHTKHQIPKGGYFDLVSSPHLFFEMIMYLCLWIIVWGNTTWPAVVIWVVSNQIETSFLSHWWYKETFRNYPKQRKAIIPYLL